MTREQSNALWRASHDKLLVALAMPCGTWNEFLVRKAAVVAALKGMMKAAEWTPEIREDNETPIPCLWGDLEVKR